jgi:hypothetical protein
LTLYGLIGTKIAFMPEYLLRLYLKDKTASAMFVSIVFIVALVATVAWGAILTKLQTWWKLRFGSVLAAAIVMLLSDFCFIFGAPFDVFMYLGLMGLGLSYGLTSSALW